jgi:hypothetical protein
LALGSAILWRERQLSDRHEIRKEAAKMALNQLKQKMSALRDEAEKYKDMYEQAMRDLKDQELKTKDVSPLHLSNVTL